MLRRSLKILPVIRSRYFARRESSITLGHIRPHRCRDSLVYCTPASAIKAQQMRIGCPTDEVAVSDAILLHVMWP
jgi:hypothetical protein